LILHSLSEKSGQAQTDPASPLEVPLVLALTTRGIVSFIGFIDLVVGINGNCEFAITGKRTLLFVFFRCDMDMGRARTSTIGIRRLLLSARNFAQQGKSILRLDPILRHFLERTVVEFPPHQPSDRFRLDTHSLLDGQLLLNEGAGTGFFKKHLPHGFTNVHARQLALLLQAAAHWSAFWTLRPAISLPKRS
jgi:hypothetical protein